MIHLYNFKGANVLIDVNSGSVHVVSETVFDVLSLFEESAKASDVGLGAKGESAKASDVRLGADGENAHAPDAPTAAKKIRDSWARAKDDIRAALAGRYSENIIDEAFREIDALISGGELFADEIASGDASPENRGAVIKAMCLHVAHDCNMRCGYCFAGTGDYAGERAMLPLDTGKRAIDFLIEQSGGRRNLEIDFFGGEPLMNFGVVKELVAYGRTREKESGKHIRFTLTTNGLQLDGEKTKFLNEHMDNVIISLDGRRDVNDRLRKTPSGAGTYDLVLENLQNFARDREGLYYVRGTYTSHNLDFAEDVRHLVRLGFKNVSVEPVVTGDDAPYAIRGEHLPALLSEYERLADFALEAEERGEPFSFFHFNIDLSQGPCAYKRAAGCGAGTEYVAVAPNGDIYPCHQFASEPDYLLGNVADSTFSNRLYADFNRAHIFSKEVCRVCWARYYCSGGCHANALHVNGDIMVPHEIGCILERKRIECAIGILAKRA